MRSLTLVFLVFALSSPAFAGFERVPELEPNVRFWRKVYAVWSGNQIAFHDRKDLSLLYRVVKVPARGKKLDGKTRGQTVRVEQAATVAALQRLNKKRPKTCGGLTDEVEKEICENLKDVARVDKFAHAANIRGQNGLRERSRRGWTDFGRYEKDVRAQLRKAGLPEELIALAFLESLYNIRAQSSANAVGMWQFLKGTARDYMHVNHVIDERVDPVLATEAATKYIKQSRKRLGAWPLAITSYNIGRAGMARGVKATGSKDLGVIVKKYKKGSFGFAAKNYYATFIALQDVIANPNAYFPGVKRKPAWRYDVVRLPFGVTTKQLYKTGAITEANMKLLNPALTKDAREGRAVLPHGFSLRVPKGEKASFVAKLMTLSVRERQRNQLRVRTWHTANGRQSVQTIARRYKADPAIVAAMAGLESAATPPKGTRVPIPATKVGYTVLPEARGQKLPAVKDVPKLVATKVTPPKDLPPAKAAPAPRVIESGPRVKLVSVRSVRLKPRVPMVDAVAGGVLPEVDIVAGVLPTDPEERTPGGPDA